VPADVPIYVARREVLDRIAGFPMHRGVLAIGLRGDAPSTSEILDRLGEAATLVVCIGIANHDNIGAIFRNAAAFGVDAVLIDRSCCDPLYRKAIRVSVGAALKVPFSTFDDVDALINLLAGRQFRQFALTPAGESDIRSAKRTPRTAIYLGAEGPGLPNDLIGRLVGTRISMAAGFDSLNVAAASAVALHCLGPNSPSHYT
jgi:tRNA G18 (ribose-2'-O)-methylase SpoU